MQIVRYKLNAEAVLRARTAENKNQQPWRSLGLQQKVIKVATSPKTDEVLSSKVVRDSPENIKACAQA